uniref:Peptidase S8/S53 domain-containing protein n=1 Tax=Quercus lobata TaxID=97700 RepID=A0A7N2M7E5_QUELO
MQAVSYTDVAFSFPLPASCLSLKNESEVKAYYNSSSIPTATIQKSIGENDELAPIRSLLFPHLTAPGVDILAPWLEAIIVIGDEGDTRIVPYNIISVTSMSCQHATAAAAYVKSFHLTWSPAAIKSTLMTTAYPMGVDKNTDAEFAYGTNHINPTRAINPGLVYDVGEIDYVNFLCGQGYSNHSLRLVAGL